MGGDRDRPVAGGDRHPGIQAHLVLDGALSLFVQFKALGGLQVFLAFLNALGFGDDNLFGFADAAVHARLEFGFEHVFDVSHLAGGVAQQFLAHHQEVANAQRLDSTGRRGGGIDRFRGR